MCLIVRYEYDPFGNWHKAQGQANIHMLFQAQQQDPESSLYYMRARYYDPFIGRFISKDPVKGYLTIPQSQNSYAYSFNNPVNLSDPSGLDVYNNSDQHIIVVTGEGNFKIIEPKKNHEGNQDGVIFQDGTIYKNNNGVDVNVQGNNYASPANPVDAAKNIGGDLIKTANNIIPGTKKYDTAGYYKLNDGTSTGNWNPGSAVSYIQSKNTGSCFSY
jgi:RHS repeat-associated protein